MVIPIQGIFIFSIKSYWLQYKLVVEYPKFRLAYTKCTTNKSSLNSLLYLSQISDLHFVKIMCSWKIFLYDGTFVLMLLFLHHTLNFLLWGIKWMAIQIEIDLTQIKFCIHIPKIYISINKFIIIFFTHFRLIYNHVRNWKIFLNDGTSVLKLLLIM